MPIGVCHAGAREILATSLPVGQQPGRPGPGQCKSSRNLKSEARRCHGPGGNARRRGCGASASASVQLEEIGKLQVVRSMPRPPPPCKSHWHSLSHGDQPEAGSVDQAPCPLAAAETQAAVRFLAAVSLAPVPAGLRLPRPGSQSVLRQCPAEEWPGRNPARPEPDNSKVVTSLILSPTVRGWQCPCNVLSHWHALDLN